MIRRLPPRLFVLALLLFVAACTSGDAATACQTVANAIDSVGPPGKFVAAVISGACSHISTLGTTGDDACQPADSDTACQTCLRTKLCTSPDLEACGADEACWCNIGCFAAEANGEPASTCATRNACGPTDDTFTAAMTAISSSCPSACSGLLKAAGGAS